MFRRAVNCPPNRRLRADGRDTDRDGRAGCGAESAERGLELFRGAVGIDVADKQEGRPRTDESALVLGHQLRSGQRRDRALAAADRVPLGRFAPEEQAGRHALGDRVRVVAQAAQVREALLAHALDLRVREGRVRHDVRQQVERGGPVAR
jgi:hypothetical protein